MQYHCFKMKTQMVNLDTGIFGIPTEKYGFSNNAKGFMRPLSFEKEKFELNTNRTIKIKI